MKISILSAVYNEARYVDEMIDSVVAQGERNWEILFVDDGSTDGTADRVRERSSTDPRIKLVSAGQKLGKVEAFNRAFQASCGEVIILLAGDDRLPPDSLAIRLNSLALPVRAGEMRAAAFRLVTFSEQRKYDGLVVPKRGTGNLSGGTIALTRPLAEKVFPIPSELVAEDIWIAEAIRAVAPDVISRPEIVLEYRIHPGNSNPRARPFHEMTDSLHERARPYGLIHESVRFQLDQKATERLRARATLEDFRHEGRLLQLITMRSVPITDRLRALSSAHPLLFWIRRSFYGLFSGFRAS